MLRHIRPSLQHQRRLTQRFLVHPNRACRRERQHFTTTAGRWSRRSTLQTNLIIIREDPCSLPTCLTRHSESLLLYTPTADYTSLRIRQHQQRITKHSSRMREVHTCKLSTA